MHVQTFIKKGSMSSWKNKLLSMVVHNIFLSPNSTITPLQLNTGHFHLDFKFIKHRHNNHHPSTPYAGHQSVNPFLVTKLTSIICERAHNLSNHNITTCQAKKKTPANSSQLSQPKIILGHQIYQTYTIIKHKP